MSWYPLLRDQRPRAYRLHCAALSCAQRRPEAQPCHGTPSCATSAQERTGHIMNSNIHAAVHQAVWQLFPLHVIQSTACVSHVYMQLRCCAAMGKTICVYLNVCVSVVSSWEQLLPTLASSKATQPLQGRLGPSNRADTTCKHPMSFFEVDIHIQQFQSIQDSAASGPLATNNGSSDRDDVTYP